MLFRYKIGDASDKHNSFITIYQQLYVLKMMMALAYNARYIFYILCIKHRTVSFSFISFATINSSKIISLYPF